jgi:hypothetical protein
MARLLRAAGLSGASLLEAEAGFLPEALPGHLDPELHLLLARRRLQPSDEEKGEKGDGHVHVAFPTKR